jgi:hypothetical protein
MSDLPPKPDDTPIDARANGGQHDASVGAHGDAVMDAGPRMHGDAGSGSISQPDAASAIADAALDAGAGVLDAGTITALDAGALHCDGGEPRVFYRDGDGDGYGDHTAMKAACIAPDGWVVDHKDCDDDQADVHPGQTEYFTTGYRPSAEAGGTSFDYDCDGSETGAPGQAIGPTSCTGVAGLLLCQGQGFAPNPSRTAAPGVNVHCGSNVISSCDYVLCEAQPMLASGDETYACR